MASMEMGKVCKWNFCKWQKVELDFDQEVTTDLLTMYSHFCDISL